MKREVWEETGLTVTSYRYRGIVTFVSAGYSEYMHLFTANAWSGAERVCDEGDLQWMNKREFAKLPMWEGDKIFLSLLEQNVPFFSLKLIYENERLIQAVLNGKNLNIENRAQE